MKTKHINSLSSYEVQITDGYEKPVIEWVRMRERGVVAMLETMCGATEEQVDEFLLKVEDDNSASFRGRIEPFYILFAVNKQ